MAHQSEKYTITLAGTTLCSAPWDIACSSVASTRMPSMP
jgi:hypothetical protein